MPSASCRGMRPTMVSGVLLACALGASPVWAAAGGDDPAFLDAEMQPRVGKALLLDVAPAGSGYLAVGERGHILKSESGEQWSQVPVPTRSTLTAMTVIEDQVWATGHDGVLLHSSDQGQSWSRRRAVPRTGHSDDPDQGAPLLDIAFLDAQTGIAVGAYATMLISRDAGETWKRRSAIQVVEQVAQQDQDGDAWGFSDDELMLDAEADPHFNAIAVAGSGALVVAGERGTFLRSRDAGRRWERLPLPYAGSMFGVLTWEGEHLMVFGLRGNVLESHDLGTTWSEVETGITDSLMGGVALSNGGALLVGANGAVLFRPDGGSPFVPTAFESAGGDTPFLSGAVARPDGSFLLIGDKGVDVFQPR